MKNFIIAKAIFIIIAGLVGSYFIIKSDGGIKLSDEKLKKENISDKFSNLIEKNPIQWIKDNFQIENFGDKIQNAGQAVGNKNQPINLTEFIAQSSFNQMKFLDQNGENPFEIDSKNSESRKIIENAIAGIQNPDLIFNPVVDDKDLKISFDNSEEAQFNYFKKMQQINKDLINPKYQRSAIQIINDFESDCLGSGSYMNMETANLYQNLSNAYLNLIVPSIQLDLHKKINIYYKKSDLIYRAIADCKKDPIKGYLAVQALPQLEDQSREMQNYLTDLLK